MDSELDTFGRAAGRFLAFFQELSSAFLERDDVLAQTALALLSREHVLLVDELSILESPPEVDALEGAGLLEAAYEELGVSIAESGHEAERARAEAVRRDGRALASRFERWFPDPDRNVAHGVLPPAELLDVIEIIVVTVAELTEYLSGSALARSVDAIEILERLLLEAGVAPWGYLRALPHATERTKSALRVLRARSA